MTQSQLSISLGSISQQDFEDSDYAKIKIKTLQTKLISDLSKVPKFQSRNHFDLQNKKNKKNVQSSNNQILRASKKTLKEISQQIKKTNRKLQPKSKGKTKVKFLQAKKSLKKQRRPSIDKSVASYDFCQSIKKMAIQLIQSNKIDQSSGQSSIQSNNPNLVCGYTEKQFNDGTLFKGICERGVMIKGELYFKNGFIYKGQLFLDKFHGQGKLFLPKGQIIRGQWNQGQIVGKAQIKYPKGQIYFGQLKHYRRHGKGHLFFKDQSKYQGQFTEGQLTGYGVYTSNQNLVTEGYWFYGDYIGQNQQVFQNIINNNAMIEKKKLQKMKDKKFVDNLFEKQNIFNQYFKEI